MSGEHYPGVGDCIVVSGSNTLAATAPAGMTGDYDYTQEGVRVRASIKSLGDGAWVITQILNPAPDPEPLGCDCGCECCS